MRLVGSGAAVVPDSSLSHEPYTDAGHGNLRRSVRYPKKGLLLSEPARVATSCDMMVAT